MPAVLHSAVLCPWGILSYSEVLLRPLHWLHLLLQSTVGNASSKHEGSGSWGLRGLVASRWLRKGCRALGALGWAIPQFPQVPHFPVRVQAVLRAGIGSVLFHSVCILGEPSGPWGSQRRDFAADVLLTGWADHVPCPTLFRFHRRTRTRCLSQSPWDFDLC